MPRRTPTLLSAAFVVGLIAGCQTEFDGCERGQEDCPCNVGECLDGLTCVDDICVAPDESNLLENPSFEEWAGDNAVFWTLMQSEAWEPIEEDPAHGVRAARVTSSSYGDVRQTVALPTPLPAGSQFQFTIQARHSGGDSTPPFIVIELVHPGGSQDDVANEFPGLSSSNWTSGSVSLQATDEVASINVRLAIAQGDAEQTLDIDDAILTQIE